MSTQLSIPEGRQFAAELQNACFRECTDCTVSGDDVERGDVKARGDIRASVVIVGEAPGEQEVREGRVFVGESGKMLDRLLKSYGINPDKDTYITNTMKCRPLGNRNPTAKECRTCREKYLAREIQLAPRKLIVALGNYGYYGVVPKGSPSGIIGRCGIFERNAEFDCQVLPCIHPAAVLRKPAYEKLMVEALKKGVKFIKNGYELEPGKPVVYREIFDLDTFSELVKEIRGAGRFVFDLETEGFAYASDRILCITFSTAPFTAWYLPLQWNEKFAWCKDRWGYIQEALRALFEDPSIGKIAFNAKFDLKFLVHHFGWDVRGQIDDPMLMHHLIEENTPHGLKALASRYTDMGDYSRPLEDAFDEIKRRRVPKTEKHYGKIPSSVLKDYAMMDADATFRVFDTFLPMIKNNKESPLLYQFYRKGVMPVMDVLMEMEMTGIRIDRQRLAVLREQFLQELADAQASFNDIVGQEVNINSSKQLSEYLFGPGGYRPVKLGKSYPSTDEGVLKKLQERTGDEIFGILRQFRKTDKLLSTYIEGMEKRLGDDGRIHTSYLQHGTATGRLSSRNPNLQNIPRESAVKTLFVPSPGYLFLDADFSQHEVRMWANYSKDPKLIEALTAGDVHSNIGSTLLEKPEGEITKGERVFVKNVVFGLMYGRGAPSLASGLSETLDRRVSEHEAARFIRLFFSMFPVATRWLSAQEDFAMEHGYIPTLFGRVRHLPEVKSRDQGLRAEARRNARNSPIQGLASDITNLALVNINEAFKREGLGARLLLQVHDAIVAEAPVAEIQAAKEIMKEQMLIPPAKVSVPLAIEIKVVDRWGGEPIEEEKASTW